MSERIVNDPSQHGWVEENGKWVWDGQSAGSIEDGDTEGQVTTWSGTAWTPESAVVVSGGNVGIGTSVPSSVLDVFGPRNGVQAEFNGDINGRGLEISTALINGVNNGLVDFNARGEGADGTLTISTDGTERMRIDATGNVGIGAEPIGEKLRVENSGEATFRVVTTSADGAANLYLNAGTKNWGIRNEADTRNFVIKDLTAAQDRLTIDSSGNATFSGTAGFNTVNNPLNLFSDETHYTIGVVSSGRTEYKSFNRHEFSCHNDATALAVSGYVEVTGAVYAADHVASSDERLKDNITTAPVGLIDSLKGREWDWSESGEKGSGVVAQELEEVLPHLVHTDDEGMKSVSYNGLVAYLIEEVKALRAEVEELKS